MELLKPASATDKKIWNKAREQIRAVMSWAWEQEIINSLPRFPKSRKQRDVAGRHYLTKSELNALYFATYEMKRPRGWDAPFSIGKYWRCALVLFFNYGLDTGTLWPSKLDHEPILWKHVSWDSMPNYFDPTASRPDQQNSESRPILDNSV